MVEGAEKLLLSHEGKQEAAGDSEEAELSLGADEGRVKPLRLLLKMRIKYNSCCIFVI